MEIENANSHPFKVAITSEGDEMYANSHPYKVSVVEGGNELVSELPETGSKGTTYVLVDDVENPSKVYGTYLYDGNEWLLVAQPVDQAVEMVEELPEEGKEGVLYYVPKTGTDTYDLYRWINNTWIKVDTDITLYDQEGNNTDGAMTQRATTEAINNTKGQAKLLTQADYSPGEQFIKAWELPVGLYRVDNRGKLPSSSAFVHWRPATDITLVEKSCNVFLVADHAQNNTSKTIVMFYSGGGDIYDGYYKIDVINVGTSGGLNRRFRLLSTQEIVDNLTSTETKEALSANQGKVLKDMIGDLANLTTTDKTNLVAAIDELVTNSPNVVSSQDWSNLWQ